MKKAATPQPRDTFAQFPTTSWTLVRRAQQGSSEVQREALGDLLRRYWKPIYACFRQMGQTRDDACELTQGLLTKFWEKNDIDTIGAQQVSFKAWLKTCALNFLYSDWRKQHAAKRHPTEGIVSFDALCAADGKPFELEGQPGVDPYDEAWRRQVLDNALRHVHELCETESKPPKDGGRLRDLEVFKAYYCHREGRNITWQQVADSFNLPDWKVASRRAEWVKEQLSKAILEELRMLYGDDTDEGLMELLR